MTSSGLQDLPQKHIFQQLQTSLNLTPFLKILTIIVAFLLEFLAVK